ncbi:MAG: glycosyltransferase family 4 protein [Xanthomonadaceae bacterium]|nr:glycosyltransferase family 4 protein [Xanthomonadaceae bacterium]
MSRLLFVTCRLPFPPREGHQLRSWNLLRAAASVHDVTLLSLRRPEDAGTLPLEARRLLCDVEIVDIPALARPRPLLGIALKWLGSARPLLDIRYVSGPLRRAFSRRVRQCDLVHLDMLALAGLATEVPAGIPIVLNEHNVESALLQDRIELESGFWRRALLRVQMARLEQFESTACRTAHRVLACSSLDADRLHLIAPDANVTVIPNGVDTASFLADFDTPPKPESLLFVGHMGWFPNRDGVEHFDRDILPLLAHRSKLHLDVVGSSDGYSPEDRIDSRIRLRGFVDDLHACLRQAAVFIVPLRLGGGTRLKVLEAMAMGKAIVSTSKGIEGIGMVDGTDVLIADRPEDFARAVERLLDDAPLRERLGRAARDLAVRRYDWRSVGQRLLPVYSELLPEWLAGKRGMRVIENAQRSESPFAEREQRHGTA